MFKPDDGEFEVLSLTRSQEMIMFISQGAITERKLQTRIRTLRFRLVYI